MRRPKNSDVPDIKACALLSSFFESLEDAELSCTNLKLSRSNRATCLFLIKNRSKDAHNTQNENPFINYYKSILVLNSEVSPYHSVLSDTIQLMLCEGSVNEHIISIKNWVIPQFTLKGSHLKNQCIGAEIANVLVILKQKWIESDFKDTNEELIKYCHDYLNK
uniref:CCA tRNA nucleotidyltransferase 1, mitochondrial (Trinotate prediction) n=1 Tax=Myxobolus squamalis TaxID=59785 RepID=A0A6B2FXZ0_MYXSQ